MAINHERAMGSWWYVYINKYSSEAGARQLRLVKPEAQLYKHRCPYDCSSYESRTGDWILMVIIQMININDSRVQWS